MSHKPIYVLGVGLTHDGSACLLKDGKIVFAIEKERITKIKHDGGNDTAAINYCLAAEGITMDDISLLVQNSNFGSFEFGNDFYNGERIIKNYPGLPVVTVSHHLAHAYAALGTSPFEETDVLVIDGCGSLFDECNDLGDSIIPEKINESIAHLYAEKDSFYTYQNDRLVPIFKDFSPLGKGLKNYPMHPPSTMHSIGGIYSAANNYCFDDFADQGKLMGLAPFGTDRFCDLQVFDLKEDRLFVNYEWMKYFKNPSRSINDFKNNFKYYADIAYFIQKHVEEAIIYIINQRSRLGKSTNLSYSGGVALNAKANSFIQARTRYKNIYITPSAGDNGIAIGCAYYGWLKVLGKKRVPFFNNSFYGMSYGVNAIEEEIQSYFESNSYPIGKVVAELFSILNEKFSLRHKDIESHAEQLVYQVIIEDVGLFSLNFNNSLVCVEGVNGKPNCTILIKGIDLIRCMISTNFFVRFTKRPDLKISSPVLFKSLIEIIHKQISSKDLAVLNKHLGLSFEYEYISDSSEFNNKVAKLLAEGNIIGWFQGGSEFGPRALGHRSIIADPRKEGVRDFINSRIKFREDFRPFAPSVLADEVSKYFIFDGDSPYMLMTAQVKSEWKDKIPAVVHEDNSCRIQTVKFEGNEKFYQLLQEFKRITSIGVLLNTSFNKRGMPIVETPSDALDLLIESNLDHVVIDNFIVSKKNIKIAN